MNEQTAQWELDSETAMRVASWLDLLIKMRGAAETVPADLLIEQLRRADPDLLDLDFHRLLIFLQQRFEGEHDRMRKLRQLEEARETRRGRAPYTAEEYDEAVRRASPRSGRAPTQQALADELGVDRKTLRKWGRPAS